MKKSFLYSVMCVMLLSCSNPLFDFESGDIWAPSSQSPTARISYDDFIYVGKEVVLKNVSKNATRCDWYCDGKLISTSSEAITKVFDYGTYNITLTVYDDRGNKDSITIPITVKGLILSVYAYEVESIYFKDSDGRYWDDDWYDGPDIFVRFFRNGANIYETNHVSDVMSSDLPYREYVSVQYSYPFSNVVMKLIDYDLLVNDDMVTCSFNPNDCLYSRSPSITVVGGKYRVTFFLKWLLE